MVEPVKGVAAALCGAESMNTHAQIGMHLPQIYRWLVRDIACEYSCVSTGMTGTVSCVRANFARPIEMMSDGKSKSRKNARERLNGEQQISSILQSASETCARLVKNSGQENLKHFVHLPTQSRSPVAICPCHCNIIVSNWNIVSNCPAKGQMLAVSAISCPRRSFFWLRKRCELVNLSHNDLHSLQLST